MKILNIMVSWHFVCLASKESMKDSHSMYIFQHEGDATGIIVISLGDVPGAGPSLVC